MIRKHFLTAAIINITLGRPRNLLEKPLEKQIWSASGLVGGFLKENPRNGRRQEKQRPKQQKSLEK